MIYKRIFLISVLFFLSGCMTTEKAAEMQLNFSGVSYPAKPENYNIEIYSSGYPQRSYELIGEINGVIYNKLDIEPLLKEKARLVGADALADIQAQAIQSPVERGVQVSNIGRAGTVEITPNLHTPLPPNIKVKAKVIKYK